MVYPVTQTFEKADETCKNRECSIIMNKDCRNPTGYQICTADSEEDLTDDRDIHACAYEKGKRKLQSSRNNHIKILIELEIDYVS